MERDLFGNDDLKRSFDDGKDALNKDLKDFSAEFFHLQFVDWAKIQLGARAIDKNRTMIAVIVKEMNEKVDAMTGFFDFKTGKFKSRQKLIVNTEEDGKEFIQWEDIPASEQFCVNNDHIYTIARITNDYGIQESLGTTRIYVKVDLFMNTHFKKDGFKAFNPEEETQLTNESTQLTNESTQLSQMDFQTQSDASIGFLPGLEDLRGEGAPDEDGQEDNEGGGVEIGTETGEGTEEFQVKDGLQSYDKNDYNYLNLTNWPREGFKFSFKNHGLVYSVPDSSKLMTRVKRRDQITMKLGEVMKGPLDPPVDGRSRGKWCFEDNYDYFLAPLDDQMRNKVYTNAFMTENFECLKNAMFPQNPKPDFNEDQFDVSVMNKCKKHYGFLEVFKKLHGEGTKYEPTGKLHYLSY